MTGDNDVQLSVMVQQLQQVRNAFSGDTLTSIYDKQQNNTTNLQVGSIYAKNVSFSM